MPSAPELLLATSLSLTVGWPAIVGTAANGIITAYYLTITFPNSSMITKNVSRSLSYSLTGLTPAHPYVFQLSAATQAGTSLLSSPLNATTLDATPSQPSAPVISPILSNSSCLYIQWQLPVQPNGVIVHYVLYQWLNNTYSITKTFSGHLYSTTLCELSAATWYNFSIQAYTILGGSALSPNTVGRTADAPALPIKVIRYIPTTTSLNITWPAPEPYVGDVIYYELYLVEIKRALVYYPLFQDTSTQLLYRGNATSFLSTRLQPATFYFHAVLAFTSAGTTNVSIITEGLTLTDGK